MAAQFNEMSSDDLDKTRPHVIIGPTDETVPNRKTLLERSKAETLLHRDMKLTNILTGVTTEVLSAGSSNLLLVHAAQSILHLGYSAHRKNRESIEIDKSRKPFSYLDGVNSRIILAQKPGGMAWCVMGMDTPMVNEAKLEVEYLMHKPDEDIDLKDDIRKALDMNNEEEINVASLGPFVSFKTPINMGQFIANGAILDTEMSKTVGLPRNPILLWPLIDTYKRARAILQMEGVTHVIMIAKKRQLISKLGTFFNLQFTELEGYIPDTDGQMDGIKNSDLFKEWPAYWLSIEDPPRLWVANLDELGKSLDQFIPPDNLEEQIFQLANMQEA